MFSLVSVFLRIKFPQIADIPSWISASAPLNTKLPPPPLPGMKTVRGATRNCHEMGFLIPFRTPPMNTTKSYYSHEQPESGTNFQMILPSLRQTKSLRLDSTPYIWNLEFRFSSHLCQLWPICDWPVVSSWGNRSTRRKSPPSPKSLPTFSGRDSRPGSGEWQCAVSGGALDHTAVRAVSQLSVWRLA